MTHFGEPAPGDQVPHQGGDCRVVLIMDGVALPVGESYFPRTQEEPHSGDLSNLPSLTLHLKGLGDGYREPLSQSPFFDTQFDGEMQSAWCFPNGYTSSSGFESAFRSKS